MSCRTCPGHCCAAFTLPRPLEEYQADPERIDDGEYVADMLIPLTREDALARAGRFGFVDSRMGAAASSDSGDYHWFTCRHWDEDTRLCTAYSERPRLCRDYPYDWDCSHGCEYLAPEPTRLAWGVIHQTPGARALLTFPC